MAYFEPSIDADGIHIPTYDDVLENLITEYKNIFGEDVYLGVETPDYQLLSMFAKHLDDMYAICVDAYNARNPDYATGNSLDLLLPLNGMSRKQATYSTVTLKLTAFDLLHRLSNKQYSINAQGRTETWNNCIPRYLMLSVAYKFNAKPQSK